MRFVHVCKNGLLVRFLRPMHVDLMGGGFFALKLYFHMAYSFS